VREVSLVRQLDFCRAVVKLFCFSPKCRPLADEDAGYGEDNIGDHTASVLQVAVSYTLAISLPINY
jgi:hypothetical protein